MHETAPTVWTITIVFLLVLMGISIGVFGMIATGAATGASVGNYYGTRLNTLSHGNVAASWFSKALSGRDVAQTTVKWQTGGSGRFVQNSYTGVSSMSFSWLLPGVHLRFAASASGRIEKYFAGPPNGGFE